MTVSAERKLQQALSDLVDALASTDARWMVIGGIAAIARGVQRFTGDIDAAIRGDEVDVATLVRALATKRIVPRIANAEEFAGESLVLLARHEPSGIELDLSFAWTNFEHDAIAAATDAALGAVVAPMARPEDLIVFKSIAGRGKDLDDVMALLTLYPALDHVKLRARVRELAALAETPELAANLDVAIAATSRSAGTSIKRPVSPARSSERRVAKRPKRKRRGR